jgi:hypothetical protein
LRWLKVVSEAGAQPALGLLLIVHRVFVTHKRAKAIYLTPIMWGQAGIEGDAARKRTLRHLKTIPRLVVLSRAQSPGCHYRIDRGPEWSLLESNPLAETQQHAVPPGAQIVGDDAYMLDGVLYDLETGAQTL